MATHTASSNSASRQEALAAIAAFGQSTAPGLWPHLDKQKLVAEMRLRVNDPFKVNQGKQPFCGPASILFELIRKQPLRYVQICRDLFEQGGFQAKTKQINASTRLRQESKGDLQMGQADWLVLATLRDAENLLFPVDPDAPEIMRNLSGMTKSWEMKGWVREILGYERVKYNHTYLLGDLGALRNADRVIETGGVAFMLVTADGLLGQAIPRKEELPVALPNHWITLISNVAIQKGTFGRHDSGQVSFDVFTWAKKMHVDAGEGPFERFLWGIVTGQIA
jgi:hypothetical protein